MAIRTYVSVKVLNDKAIQDRNIHIFRNDRGIDLYINLLNFSFVISKLKAPVREAGATVLKPDNTTFEVNTLTVDKENIIFTITHDMTDELQEVGTYKIQIHLYDELDNRVSVPYIQFKVNPLVGDDNLKNNAIVGKAIVGNAVISSEVTLFNIEDGYIKTVWKKGDIITAEKLNNIEEALLYHSTKLQELLYVAINIASMTISKSNAELGEVVSGVTINWTLNKTPTSQKLNGVTIDNSLRTHTYTSSISSNKTFTLVVDDGTKTATKSASINFYNGRYYGVSSSKDYGRELILGLNKTLTNSRGGSFNVNCGVGQYVYFAIPTRLGTPTFSVGGFKGGFEKAITFNFENKFGYVESYDLWKSENSNLGNITVVVG